MTQTLVVQLSTSTLLESPLTNRQTRWRQTSSLLISTRIACVTRSTQTFTIMCGIVLLQIILSCFGESFDACQTWKSAPGLNIENALCTALVSKRFWMAPSKRVARAIGKPNVTQLPLLRPLALKLEPSFHLTLQ